MDIAQAKRGLYPHLKEISEACGVSRVAVYQWAIAGRVPVPRVLTVERITGIPRHVWRPDIYPPDERAPARGKKQYVKRTT